MSISRAQSSRTLPVSFSFQVAASAMCSLPAGKLARAVPLDVPANSYVTSRELNKKHKIQELLDILPGGHGAGLRLSRRGAGTDPQPEGRIAAGEPFGGVRVR